MSISRFQHVKVAGMKTVIPEHYIDIDDELQYFDNNPKKLARQKISPEESRAVADEATAQMEKYRAAGLPWMHLDSHHHTHTDWSIARVVMPIARKMGFKSVRRARDLGSGMGLFNRAYKTLINRYLGRTIGFESQRFGSYRDVVGCVSSLPKQITLEMMVHPMYKLGDRLDLAGDLLDTNHPLDDIWKVSVDCVTPINMI